MRRDAEGANLIELCWAPWQWKWPNSVVTATFVALVAVCSFAVAPWLRAKAVLALVDSNSPVSQKFCGPVSISGIGIRGVGHVGPFAVLQSHYFARVFVESENVLSTASRKNGEAATLRWKRGNPDDSLDTRDSLGLDVAPFSRAQIQEAEKPTRRADWQRTDTVNRNDKVSISGGSGWLSRKSHAVRPDVVMVVSLDSETIRPLPFSVVATTVTSSLAVAVAASARSEG